MKKLLYAAAAVTVLIAAVLAWRREEPPQAAPKIDPAQVIEVNAYYGTYDTHTKESGFVAGTLRGPRLEQWKWGVRPAKRYRLGVLFPNSELTYWSPVRRGIEQEAALSNVDFELLVAEDYTHVDQQQQQFETLIRNGADAIVLGSIHYRAMDALVERATSGAYGRKIPVVAFVNDINAPTVSGKVRVSFFDMGRIAGRIVFDEAQAAKRSELTIAMFPGPINAGWAPDSLRGFLSVIRDYPGELHVISPQWGTPDAKTQTALVESVLEANPTVDYIVGAPIVANVAIDILRATGRQTDVRIVSMGYTEELAEPIRNGVVAAAPWDQSQAVGRIAVGMAIRILNGEKPGSDLPFQLGPSIVVKSRENT